MKEFCYIHLQQEKKQLLLWEKHDLDAVREQLRLHGNALMPKTSGSFNEQPQKCNPTDLRPLDLQHGLQEVDVIIRPHHGLQLNQTP